MKQIYHDLGTNKVVFIRFNPDEYIPSYGKKFNITKRYEYLLKRLQRIINDNSLTALSVHYLFYDGFSEIENVEDVIDPYQSSMELSIKHPLAGARIKLDVKHKKMINSYQSSDELSIKQPLINTST